MWACDSGCVECQQWTYTPLTKQIKNKDGICLDANERNKKGGKVSMWSCNFGPNQQWDYDATTGQIKSTHGLCLDAPVPSKNGWKVQMWTCNASSKNQRWTIWNVHQGDRILQKYILHINFPILYIYIDEILSSEFLFFMLFPVSTVNIPRDNCVWRRKWYGKWSQCEANEIAIGKTVTSS